jgi:radical SAM-linked protein
MRVALEFAKKNAAKYISHLDVQRAFSRAIRRSGLPVKLSAGFNPHYVVSFASALSLGIESSCECVEAALLCEMDSREFLQRIARALPPGLEARRAVRLRDDAPKLMAALKEAAYAATINKQGFDAALAVADIMASAQVIGIKTKDGKQRDINIRPMIIALCANSGQIDMRLAAAQSGSLRPDMVLDAIAQRTGSFDYRLKRTGLFAHKNGEATDLLTAFMM